MIHVVTEANRTLFKRELFEMHRHRKLVFVDRMKWRLPCEEGLEIDAFDTGAAIYLLDLCPRLGLRASARMLATDRPHLLDTVFPHLCQEPVPRGPDIWEATRFCPAPDIAEANEKRALLGCIIAGIMEAGLLFGMNKVTFVAGGALKPLALRAGWTARVLGETVSQGRDRVTACVADIDPAGLRRVRDKHGLHAPLLRYREFSQAA